MEDFFRTWNTPHFLFLYGILFAVQVLLFIAGCKKQKDRYWISLVVLQIFSVWLVLNGYDPGGKLGVANNIVAALITLPVYAIFFFVTLAKRSSIEKMPGTKIWKLLLIGAFFAVTVVPTTLRVIKAMQL